MITQDNLSLWKQRIEEQKSSGLGGALSRKSTN